MIEPIARHFNRRALLEAGAPTLRTSHARFRQIESLSSALIQSLGELTPEENTLLRGALSSLPILRKLNSFARQAADKTQENKRGSPKLLHRFQAPAKMVLAVHCADLLDTCGCEVTGHVAANNRKRQTLASLVRCVFQYAVKASPEGDGAGLEFYVKKVGALHSRRSDILGNISNEFLRRLSHRCNVDHGFQVNTGLIEGDLIIAEKEIDDLAGGSFWRTYKRPFLPILADPYTKHDGVFIIEYAGVRLDQLTDRLPEIWANGPH